MSKFSAGVFVLCVAALSPVARGNTLCTLLTDAATGTVLKREGSGCDQRLTPVSTFKIALSLIGYDSGFLTNEHLPAIPYRDSYLASDPAWKTTIDPSSWIKDSVVWYSQQITTWLGKERLQRYLKKFSYGNQDLSGNPGMDDGLTQAWLSSSLLISPLEQAGFLGKVAERQLPVSEHALEMTRRITSMDKLSNDWTVNGKTGTGFHMKDDGTTDLNRQIGWFVGWASKGGRVIVFVHATADDKPEHTRAGPRARDAFMEQLPRLLNLVAAAPATTH